MKIKDEGKTADECLAKSHSWLDKAVMLEATGKNDGMVSRAVDVACGWENSAFDGRA